MKLTPGTKITKTLYMSVNEYSGDLTITDFDMSTCESFSRPTIGTFEVEVTIPEFDPTALQVEMLENKLARLNAEHHLAATKIKEQIQSLKAIGHDGDDE